MPYVFRRSLSKSRLAGMVGAALLATATVPAVAGAACPTTPTTKAFSTFGDTAALRTLVAPARRGGPGARCPRPGSLAHPGDHRGRPGDRAAPTSMNPLADNR